MHMNSMAYIYIYKNISHMHLHVNYLQNIKRKNVQFLGNIFLKKEYTMSKKVPTSMYLKVTCVSLWRNNYLLSRKSRILQKNIKSFV